jgi:hypothetical protein
MLSRCLDLLIINTLNNEHEDITLKF